MSNKKKNSSGVAWSAIERFAIQGSQFVVSMIVARLLLPADYGVIAMMAIFIAVSTSLIDSGMSQALIQRQGRSETDKSTALIYNICIASILYAIIYLLAPYIAQFYNMPELCKVARIYSTILIINSLSTVQQALVIIDLNFKRQAIASLTGIAVGGVVAIAMAYGGYGVWSLVAQLLVNAVVYNALLWALSPWRPRSGFSWESLKVLSSFGSKIMASGLINTIYTNMYTLVIGKYFAATELGLYSRAYTITRLPSSNISTIVDRVLFPILCGQQASVEDAVATLHRYLRVVCFVVFPAMVGIAAVAKPLILVLLGDKWIETVPFIQLLAIYMMWDPIMLFHGSIIRSQGRSADFLRAEIIKKCCGVAILILTIPFGVMAMCAGLTIYAFADIAIIIFFARKISPSLGYSKLIKVVGPTILLTAFMGGVVWCTSLYTSSLPPIVELTIGIIVGVSTLLATALATKRPEPREIIETIKVIIKK